DMETVTIPTSGSATYTVATVNDDTDEPNGSVTVTVADGTGYTVGTPSEASVTVNDNDDDDEEAPLGAADAAEVVIFPNPSGRYLEVRSSIGWTFQILSLSGKPLLEGTTNTRTDITSLRSGLYLVQLPDGRLLKLVRE
ncbi:MAG: T9SS type A sorting domain-containing protein, partial [Ekhidna sp.]|nr:T9SS type A sorting domain-containing protein [Ekhidna sp.]